jgi:hypothetical protein
MKTRQTYLWRDKSQAAAGTETIDIRVKDPITRLVIPFGVTLSTGARLAPISAVFSNISIIDGSDVLMSLRGTQIAGIAHLDKVHNPAMFNSNNISTTDYGNLVIQFGRNKWDKVLAFDPSKFKNPQIQLTFSPAAVQAAATVCDFAILADIMESGGVNPIGFLMKKEAKSWTAASATHEYTKLARDYKYRRLFLQARTIQVGVGAHWSNAKLSEDNDKRIPFDVIVDDQIAENAIDYGIITELAGGTLTNGSYPLIVAPTYAPAFILCENADYTGIGSNKQDGGYMLPKTNGGSDQYSGICQGLCPHGLVAFDFGDINNPDDWYDPTLVGDLQLDVTGAGAQTVRLVTEQIRTY